MRLHRSLLTAISVLAVGGTALIGAPAASAHSSGSHHSGHGSTGTRSLAAVLASDGNTFDHNPYDYDIVTEAVLAVLADDPTSPVAVLADGKVALTAFIPTDQAFRYLVHDLTGTWVKREKDVFAAVAGLGLPTVETVLLYHVVPGATITKKAALKSDGAKLATAQGGSVKVDVRRTWHHRSVTLIDKVGQGPAILIGISVGLICGLINSALIITSGALTQAESLFITFGMSLVYGAVALMYVQGVTQFLTYSTTDISIFNAINSGGIGFLSVSAVLFLACLAVLYVIERRTYLGRAVVLTGGNKVAARLAGIPITRTIVFIYAVSGVMSAIGAVVLVSRVTLADPTMGTPYTTQAILAVVVGGTALMGGRGSVLWTVVGTLLLILLNNCLNLLGVSTYIQFVLRGVILILAIWLDRVKQDLVSK